MYLTTLLSKIKEFQTIDESVVISLYTLSSRSLFILISLSMLTTIALYPILGISILYWFFLLVVLSLYRLYSAFLFKNNPTKYTITIWYRKFIFSAILTALTFSTLGVIFVHQVGHYYQLYIIAVLLGLSSGSTVSLFPDIRLNIGYALILLLPISLTMLFLDETPLHFILSISLLLYFLAQVVTIYKIYTERNEFNILKSEHKLLDSLFKNAPLGIFTYNNDLKILECNEQLNKLFGHDTGDLIGMDINVFPDKLVSNNLKEALSQGYQSYEGPYMSLKGNEFWIDLKAFSFVDNGVTGGVGMIEDKRKEHDALAELEYMVQHDVLTGLLNRRGLKNFIEGLVSDKKHETFFSILFYIDLNQFKSINDSLGHAVGDDVLLAVSERIVEALDEDCMISRLGGDEFIIIMPYITEDLNLANEKTKEHSSKIQDIFLEPFIIKEMHLNIKSSIGIVLVEPGYNNTEEIIRYADLSMYQAKTDKGNVSYYDSSLDKKQKELFLLQHDLAFAVDRNQFEIHFQPIVNIIDNSLYSIEALIRWQHPDKGLLSPDAFIPLSIKAGLLSKITWCVIDQVCEQVSEWKKFNLWNLEYVSINVNAQQLIENNFAEEFLSKLEFYGLESKDILVEITERSLIDNFNSTQDVITTLHKKGVKCAIDDFGIGYSSLSYLKKLSFNTLKIDKEFIKNIESNPHELLLVSSILDIGRQFNYNIVIEGVEDKKQKQLLIGLDENLKYQGYHFSKPLHPEVFREKFLY